MEQVNPFPERNFDTNQNLTQNISREEIGTFPSVEAPSSGDFAAPWWQNHHRVLMNGEVDKSGWVGMEAIDIVFEEKTDMAREAPI